MPDVMISGIPVSFPFEPYDVQKAYMERVIESLQNNTNALLESPTGTGKTLSLLCSSLAWLLVKKAQLQMHAQVGNFSEHGNYSGILRDNLKTGVGKSKENMTWGMPKIIYSSRTHSQLTQAMQELKRSSYRHVKATVLGSRDQMCIHPEVSKETNNMNKVHMCQLKVKSRSCHFYNNVESKKEDRSVKGDDILDIEDLVSVGKKLKCCPYYLSKELKQDADIIFMPYNYILDPKSRKANGVELMNNIVILDEGHNVEKMCEESASLQIRTTDVALCIDEITHVMKSFGETSEEQMDVTVDNQPKDFTSDDLCVLKEMMLALEKAIDEINVGSEGTTYPGGFIFELLSKAEVKDHNQMGVITLIDNLIQYLSTANASPFQRKGLGLQKIVDLLNVVFSGTTHAYKERVKMCYKVHVQIEDKKNNKKTDSWGALKSAVSKTAERVLSYWCFSPGFGMKQLLDQNVRSIILTSGTLAPLKPLMSELGIPIGVKLENPHIVKANQICVKIISQGPDGVQLNSNYQNRDDPKYICSLGRTILSFCRVVPDGLLVFFPSYPIMNKCQEVWQSEGIWSSINNIKPVFVEPQRKDTFNSIINEYYSRICDPNTRGACFMAVCRGKVSEGLDFADMNGRAVIITGLPFPPLKDPRIILKKKYLEELRVKEKDFLSGDEWYSLEATRAVNQAIGRVIRHQNDYGAILLCDSRFNSPKLKGQLSAWLRSHINVTTKFGETVSEICRFFKNAQSKLPSPQLKPLLPNESNNQFLDSGPINVTGVAFPAANTRVVKSKNKKSVSQYPNSNEVYADFSIDFYKKAQSSAYVNEFKPKETKDLFSALDFSNDTVQPLSQSSVNIHKRNVEDASVGTVAKRKKLKIKPFGFEDNLTGGEISSNDAIEREAPSSLIDFVKEIKVLLQTDQYKHFQTSISAYKKEGNYSVFLNTLSSLLENSKTFYLFKGMKRFLKDEHKGVFQEYCDNVKFYR